MSLGNKHHIAIFEDGEGKLSEEVVSFFEASERIANHQPIINSHNDAGHPLKFTLKQNDYFVFPADDFDPSEVDLLNHENYALISPNLFRVQKLTDGDYFFRHHLETTVESDRRTLNKLWKRISSRGLMGVKKVQVSRLGEIVKVGE